MTTAINEAVTPLLPFARRLRDETITEHRATERSPFVLHLLKGKLPLSDFAAMTAQWHFLYGTLESEVTAARSHPLIAQFADDRVARLAHIDADLAVLIGADWQTRIAPLPATDKYVARLRELGAEWPAGLLAHHYLRYMGDLSGGQIIARVARRTYGLEADAGLSFYAFDQIPDGQAYKTAYRDRLNAAGLTEAEQLALIGEVDNGYRMAAAIFAQLESSVVGQS